jgi:hypothetical protein
MKRGKGLPDENVIREMAAKLNTTFEYLVDGTDEQKKPDFVSKVGLEEDDLDLAIKRILPSLSQDHKQALLSLIESLPKKK